MLDPIDLYRLKEHLRSQQITQPAEVERIVRDCNFLAEVKGITDPAELLRQINQWHASGIGNVIAGEFLRQGNQVSYWFREATGRELPLGPVDPALGEYFDAVHPDLNCGQMTAPEIAAILRADCTQGRTPSTPPVPDDLPRIAYFRDLDGCPYQVDPNELRHRIQTQTEVFGLWPRRRPEHHDTWVVLPLKRGVGHVLRDEQAFEWCAANHQDLPEPLKERFLATESRPTTTPGPVTPGATATTASAWPAPAAPQQAARPRASINARMLETIQADPAVMGWNTRKWAEHLKCAKSSVVETQTWKNLTMCRDGQRAERARDRRRRSKGRGPENN